MGYAFIDTCIARMLVRLKPKATSRFLLPPFPRAPHGRVHTSAAHDGVCLPGGQPVLDVLAQVRDLPRHRCHPVGDWIYACGIGKTNGLGSWEGPCGQVAPGPVSDVLRQAATTGTSAGLLPAE